MESPQLQRVRDARSGLLMTHPFFGVLSLKLAIRETTAISTAGVNAQELVFNATFVDTLSNVELKGLIAHEVMHLALGHHARQGNRHPQLWNLAADFALNPALVTDGFTLPPGGCIDPQYNGMSAEAIYDKLRDSVQQAMAAAGAGAGPQGQGWGDFDSAGPEGSAEAQESAREWAENAAEALRAASSAGKLPAGIKRVVDAALAPKADWKALTRRWMSDNIRTATTWSKPNKRFPGIYLPGKIKDGLGPVALMIDTSGSIDAHTLGVFEAGCNDIISDLEPSAVHVIYCDAAVNRVDTFEAGEPVRLQCCGGGGTDFRPPFQRVADEGWALSGAIYLTDLMGSFPAHAPEYPVLWASYGAGGAEAPHGETVAIDG